MHNDNKEWFYWFNEGKCQRPNNWHCLSQTNDLQLNGGEQVPLLLKFISFREPLTELEMRDRPPADAQDPKYLAPRKAIIRILDSRQVSINSMEVKIKPREQFCDQIFRFYEPQGT